MVSLFLLLGCNLSYIVVLFAALHELASASARTLLKLASSVRALLKPYWATLSLFKMSTVFRLHFAPSLHLIPGLQSAFYPWSAVCILTLVYSLHFISGLQSAFYLRSAVCILSLVCSLRYLRSLHFTLTVFNSRLVGMDATWTESLFTWNCTLSIGNEHKN